MKAITYRCLCPKPSYVITELITPRHLGGDVFKVANTVKFDDNILHWRTATTECLRCGVPLCEKCADSYAWITKPKGLISRILFPNTTAIRLVFYCPTCAEEMR